MSASIIIGTRYVPGTRNSSVPHNKYLLYYWFMLINHVTVLVSDKGIAEDFYVNKLGLKKYPVGKSLWIAVGDQFIHITQNSGPSIAGTFYHFAICVENLMEYLKGIIDKGVVVFDIDDKDQPIRINQELDAPKRLFFVRDPDGNLIEFVDSKNRFFISGGQE